MFKITTLLVLVSLFLVSCGSKNLGEQVTTQSGAENDNRSHSLEYPIEEGDQSNISF